MAREDFAGPTWPEVLRAYGLIRAGVATVGGVLGHSTTSDADPQVTMALIETSHATHRALVKLAEAREVLAELSRENPSQGPMSEDMRVKALRRLDGS